MDQLYPKYASYTKDNYLRYICQGRHLRLEDLATLYSVQTIYEQAELLYQCALRIKKALLELIPSLVG